MGNRPVVIEDDEATRGWRYSQRFVFRNSDQTLKDLTGAAFVVTIEDHEDIVWTYDTTHLAQGEVIVSLTDEQTRNFPGPVAVCTLADTAIFGRPLFRWRVDFDDA